MNLLTHFIEFPALGWKFNLDPVLIELGPLKINWYGLLIATGFMMAVVYAMWKANRHELVPDRIIDVTLPTVVAAFIGARLYYVFFSQDVAWYFEKPFRILEVWNGGLGIYGGVIVAFLFGLLMCKIYKVNYLAIADLASLGFLIGQCIGRWGNFFNQEAFGGNTTLPWGMTGDIIQAGHNVNDEVINSGLLDPAKPVHPTFLYESLLCLVGFILLHILAEKCYRFKGQIFCGYLVWYGVGRFFIESLRTDSLHTGTMKTSQLVAIIAVTLGIALFFILRRRTQILPKNLEDLTAPITTLGEEENHGSED